MNEYLTSFLSLFISEQSQLLTMFLSAFLSATLLPASSEVIFTAIASKHILAERSFFSVPLLNLLAVATVGNSLGSLVTYFMGKLLPKPIAPKSPYAKWALEKSERYGEIMLLFSWLPLVGDLLCGIAGWLRFNVWQTTLFIVMGKLARYLVLLGAIYPTVKYLL